MEQVREGEDGAGGGKEDGAGGRRGGWSRERVGKEDGGEVE